MDLLCATTCHAGNVADEAVWSAIEGEGGALEAAFLNAGVAGTAAPLAKLSLEDWKRVMAVNMDGLFLSLRAAMRLANDEAAIVLTASVAGVKAEPGIGPYGASKAGAIQLAKITAKEGAPRRIRVNAIAPGGVDTGIWDDIPMFANLVEKHQGNRAGALDEMASLAPPHGPL